MILNCIKNVRPLSFHGFKTFNNVQKSTTNFFNAYSTDADNNNIAVGGLAQALGKFREMEKSEALNVEETVPKPSEHKSFLHLLRHSEFVQMGDPVGKIVIGKIFQVVNTDLYIDFGGKFYCVCRKPKRNSELYVRNAKVKLRINELELCARFLGAVEDLTLTEASGTLLDLVWTPVSSKKVIGQEINKDGVVAKL